MENFVTHINPLLKLSVSELEQMAYALYEANSFNNYTHLIRDCLWERRNKLNARFEFTQEAIERLRFMNDLVQRKQDSLLGKCVSMSFDFIRERESEKGLPYDVIIEGEIDVRYDSDRPLNHPPVDENNNECDYEKVAEILSDYDNITSALGRLHCIELDETMNSHMTIEAFLEVNGYEPSSFDYGKTFEYNNYTVGRYARQLAAIPVNFAFACLVDHSKYSFSDIIRINDVKEEIKVGLKSKI